jgi:hypothetical protein
VQAFGSEVALRPWYSAQSASASCSVGPAGRYEAFPFVETLTWYERVPSARWQ